MMDMSCDLCGGTPVTTVIDGVRRCAYHTKSFNEIRTRIEQADATDRDMTRADHVRHRGQYIDRDTARDERGKQ